MPVPAARRMYRANIWVNNCVIPISLILGGHILPNLPPIENSPRGNPNINRIDITITTASNAAPINANTNISI